MKILQTPLSRVTALLALSLSLFVSSCDKDDDVVKPLESAPITKTFFLNTPVTILATGSGNYEYGMKFQVTQNGKVSKLGSRMPDAGNYRVTLWDASVTPKVVIDSVNITQAAGALTFSSITPKNLVTGKDYFISIWSSGQWYEIRPSTAGAFTYPITIGSVNITGYQWVGSARNPQTFPTNAESSYIAGLADFEFQPD